jgi:hypothetical protein
MKSKFLEFGFGVFLYFWLFAHLAHASPLGRCYPSTKSFLQSEYGDAYEDDENIATVSVDGVVGAGFSESPEPFWVLDKTPGSNITRSLLQLRLGHGVCVILYAPMAAEINAKFGRHGELPREVTSKSVPSAGFPSIWLNYSLEKSRRIFVAKKCFKVDSGGAKQAVNCSKVFYEQ